MPIAAIKDRLDRLLNESGVHLHENFQMFKNGHFKCKDYLFTCLHNPDVPYDNNASERGIRKIEVKQKIRRLKATLSDKRMGIKRLS